MPGDEPVGGDIFGGEQVSQPGARFILANDRKQSGQSADAPRRDGLIQAFAAELRNQPVGQDGFSGPR